MGLASSSSTPLHTCPRKFLGTTAWKVVSCTWCPCWVTEIGDRPCECSWAARFSLPFYTSPIWHQKGSKCQQRPDPYEARVVLRCGCFAFPNRGLLAQYTLASTFTAREFSSQVQFPTKYSSSQQPKQGEGTALACSASVTGHLLLRESLLSQFHLPTRCAPLLGRLGAWVAGEWDSLVADSCPSEALPARARCSEHSDLCRMAGRAELVWIPVQFSSGLLEVSSEGLQ